MLTTLETYDALRAHTDDAPVVRFEVGPSLLAPAMVHGGATLFLRESQRGFPGAVGLGDAAGLAELLGAPWRAVHGYSDIRSLTVEAHHRDVLLEAGAPSAHPWTMMCVDAASWASPPSPAPAGACEVVSRSAALKLLEAEHDTRWVPPQAPGQQWLGLRVEGALVATGLASLTPAGSVRLTSIVVAREHRGRGWGRAMTAALVNHSLARAGTVILGVEQGNEPALGLYAQMGFRVAHRFVSGTLGPLS